MRLARLRVCGHAGSVVYGSVQSSAFRFIQGHRRRYKTYHTGRIARYVWICPVRCFDALCNVLLRSMMCNAAEQDWSHRGRILKHATRLCATCIMIMQLWGRPRWQCPTSTHVSFRCDLKMTTCVDHDMASSNLNFSMSMQGSCQGAGLLSFLNPQRSQTPPQSDIGNGTDDDADEDMRVARQVQVSSLPILSQTCDSDNYGSMGVLVSSF